MIERTPTAARNTTAQNTTSQSIGLFPGQGSQFVGMGAGLVRRYPQAAEVFDEASDAVDVDLRSLCWRSTASELALTENAQLAIAVCAVAAWRVWKANPHASGPHASGPDAVAGHSVGALPAAIASGHLTLRDGTRLVRTRAQLMGGVPRTGSMIAVSVTSEAMVQDVLASAERFALDVAAHNGARQVVLSGGIPAIEAAKAHFGARARVLEVSNGFHSRLMDPIVADWAGAVAATVFNEADGPAYVASTTGETAAGADGVRADLVAGLRNTVRWDAVIGDKSRDRWITFGTASALARFGRGVIRSEAITTVDDTFVPRLAHVG
jgi:[acyl-carrier-protein] S-malonyltransferase